ncbi:hypothetical protein PUNSTDRAFT_52366 [Punctularia strigosozonata HHB-11173 SS5]|uniref:uncharacterized protein n=1 Tax=Punctularia strigosozonata (strain HHB-11173) TaxID=741275 RepID=UPI0004418380|nr:uncharacterized protein PUNSTDRAFT_52366 [Punctularia strigosozonata HHB-11173 SS5]EIN08897.1 hypothetical protein PUNSTDRAFT_52366 [Punctularia strigosozonata HHB-11173 SS5]
MPSTRAAQTEASKGSPPPVEVSPRSGWPVTGSQRAKPSRVAIYGSSSIALARFF